MININNETLKFRIKDILFIGGSKKRNQLFLITSSVIYIK
jgi:hypothetical protein